MKKLAMVAFIVITYLTGTAGAATITVGGNSDYAFATRNSDWDQNIESESGSAIKVGSHFNYNVDE